jgi:hypothetical protein
MKIIRTAVVAAALALTGIAGANAQGNPSPELMQAANDLVALQADSFTSSLRSGVTAQTWQLIESELRNRYPKIDAATLAELRQEYERVQTDIIAGMIREAPLTYARYFTAEELRGMINFYKTPLGAKMANLMPRVMSELTAQGWPQSQLMQQQLMQRFDILLRSRGYE